MTIDEAGGVPSSGEETSPSLLQFLKVVVYKQVILLMRYPVNTGADW